MSHPSFRAFVEAVVLPMRRENPADRRLDGQVSGGNFAVVGTFDHAGRTWKVHADTHYEPLLAAYEAITSGNDDPFVEHPTKQGMSLDVEPSIRAKLSTPRYKYLYIYEV